MDDIDTTPARRPLTRRFALGALATGTAAAVGLIMISPADASPKQTPDSGTATATVENGTATITGPDGTTTKAPASGWVMVDENGKVTSGDGPPPGLTPLGKPGAAQEGWAVAGPDGLVDSGTGPMPEKYAPKPGDKAFTSSAAVKG